jgi:hypothetical protein
VDGLPGDHVKVLLKRSLCLSIASLVPQRRSLTDQLTAQLSMPCSGTFSFAGPLALRTAGGFVSAMVVFGHAWMECDGVDVIRVGRKRFKTIGRIPGVKY